MNKPHKHAALIKAWADGAEIQYKIADFEWKDFIGGYVIWDEREEYRIKLKEVRLEAGKFYKTRCGTKVYIENIECRGEQPPVARGYIQSRTTWALNGERHKSFASDLDIIGEWEDE